MADPAAQREEELERRNEALQQLVHMAAHELQSPLYALSGCLRLLQEECAGKLAESGETYLGLAQDSARRMQSLVQDLQAYCRVDSRPLAVQEVDMDLVFKEVRFALATPMAEANAEVRSPPLPALRGDRAFLFQLLANLVGNAVKFRHKGRPPRVEVRAESRGPEWLFEIRDNGIGIDPRFHRQVFEMFRRLHSQEAYPGSGLGLSICRRIVERHGGRLWVESVPGEGSAFFFTLPALPEDSPPGQE